MKLHKSVFRDAKNEHKFVVPFSGIFLARKFSKFEEKMVEIKRVQKVDYQEQFVKQLNVITYNNYHAIDEKCV